MLLVTLDILLRKKDSKLQELKIGKTGFEQKYNSLLQGKEGLQKIESHASGKIVRLLEAKKSKSGKNLDTYISKNLQEYCFKQLQRKKWECCCNECEFRRYNFTCFFSII